METMEHDHRDGEDEVVIRNRTDDEVRVRIHEENGHDVIEVEVLDVEECGRTGRTPPPAKRYRVRIDREQYVFDTRKVTARELLERANRVPVERFEIEMGMRGAGFVSLEYDQEIDLGRPGIEVFQTFPLDEQEG